MRMFTQELQNMLSLPNKEDKFMHYKIKLAKLKAKQRREEHEKKMQKALAVVESDSEEDAPTNAVKLADNEVDKL